MNATATAVATQIADLLTSALLDRVAPVGNILGEFTFAHDLLPRVGPITDRLAVEIMSGDDALAAQVVISLMPLFPDPIPPEWWATTLGRVCARSLSHGTSAAVSWGYAGNVLGVKRQTVQVMVRRGNLRGHADGGVDRASLLHEWLRRQERAKS